MNRKWVGIASMNVTVARLLEDVVPVRDQGVLARG